MEHTLSPQPPVRMPLFWERNKGVIYVLLAQIFGVLMNLTTRLLELEGNHGAGMHPFQILFVRMGITIVLATTYMWYSQTPHFPFGLPEVRWLLGARAVGGFFGVFGMYYSLIYLPLADATVVTFLAPSLSCLACYFLLREPFTRLEQVGTLISFIGIVLIARPTALFSYSRPDSTIADGATDGVVERAGEAHGVTAGQRAGAVCVALLGVLGSAMAFTAMRSIGKRAHPLLSVNYFSICCLIISGLAMAVLPSVDFLLPQSPKEWAYLVFLGVCGFTMQFLLSAGLQHDKSSRATNMVYTQMLWALLFDKLIFGTTPSMLSIMGSGLILSSAIFIAVRKANIKQREDEAKAKQAAANEGENDVEMQLHGEREIAHEEQQGLVKGTDRD